MTTQFCARIGEHAVSLVAIPKVSTVQSFAMESVESHVYFEKTDIARITTVKEFIQTLQEIVRALMSLSHHPIDQALVGIDESSINQIRLVLVRTHGQNGRPVSYDVEAEAQLEAAVSKKLAATVRPIATDIAKGDASAEEVMKLLNQQPDPNRARKIVLTHVNSPSTILLNNDVVIEATENSAVGTTKISGAQVHHIQIRIITLMPDKSTVQARLMACLEPTDLFKSADIEFLSLSLKVFDADNLFVLSQAAFFGWNINIAATFDVTLSHRSCVFEGNLISVADRQKLAADIATAVSNKTAALF